MTLNIIAVTGVGIAAAVLSAVLRQYGGEYRLYISIAAGIVILCAVLNALPPLLELIGELRDAAGIDNEYVAALLKALAVCCVTQLASDCCRDSGETAIASKIDLAARAAVLLICVPLFGQLLKLIRELIL